MDKRMGRRTTTKMGSYIFPHFGYDPDELVFRNKVATWNCKMGCLEGKFYVNF